jgi:hypothetical protein
MERTYDDVQLNRASRELHGFLIALDLQASMRLLAHAATLVEVPDQIALTTLRLWEMPATWFGWKAEA